MASPDKFHLARKMPAMTLTDFESNIDMEKLCQYRLGRVRHQLVRHDMAGCLLYDPINIRYATGSRNMSVYTMHAAERYAFIATDGPVILFDSYPVGTPEIVDERRPARTWYYEVTQDNTFDACQHWAAEIADIMSIHGGGNKRIAIDRMATLGYEALMQHDLVLCDGGSVMEQARLIKSPEEVSCMSVAVGACDIGMARMREALRPGITENYLWSILAQTNIELGGEWLECRLLSSGGRTNPWYQEASDKLIRSGDLVAFDTDMVGPYGYCADISRTFHCGPGKPTPRQKELYRLAYEQVHHNQELIRPGVSFRELSENSWRGPAEFEENRYVCMYHGVGLVDEYPDIAHPLDWDTHGYDGVIEENMVLCIESYIGQTGDSEGVKLEQQVVVTDYGIQSLSTFPFEENLLG
jgi:Xaa-Pro aminopeptidase